MVFVVPSVYDTNKYTRRTTSIFSTNYRWLGLFPKTYSLHNTKHWKISMIIEIAHQLLLPTTLWEDVSQHQESGIYLGKLSGCHFKDDHSEKPWEAFGVKHLEVESPLCFRIQLVVSMLRKWLPLKGRQQLSSTVTPLSIMLCGFSAQDVLPSSPKENVCGGTG